MRALCIVLLAVLLSGCMCTTTRVETILDDGTSEVCTAYYVSWFIGSEEASGSACGASLASKGTNPDTQLLQSILRAALAVPAP